MKFKDRITGGILSELPEEIESGRYSIVANNTILNKHTVLEKNDVIFSDGKSTCRLSDSKHTFKKEQTVDELAFDAVITIYELMEHQLDTKISPLLPSSLVGKEINLSPLEQCLEQTLKQGHLHHISFKPRIDLKYDEAIIDVSRAKRLSNRTLKHLASHSECWQRRTLTGVIPRKVLARFSEDDYGLYENHLYISLLDKLESHLYKRLRKLIQLNEELSTALEFQTDADNEIHYKLSQEICSLWGKTFDPEQTDQQLKVSEKIQEFLETSMLTIKGLKQNGVYPKITRRKHITHLHRTNILKHDSHYQHLPPLWDNIQKEVTSLKPAEVFKQNKRRFEAYIFYIGLVIHYAIDKYKSDKKRCFSWAEDPIELKKNNDRWVLTTNGETLELIAWVNEKLPDTELLKNQMICWVGNSQERKRLEKYSSIPNACLISPLDLYVVERMGALIDRWLINLLTPHYGKSIFPVPKELLKSLSKTSEIKIQDDMLKVMEPLSKTNKKLMFSIIDKAKVNEETKVKIKYQIDIVNELSICPSCRQKGILKPSSSGFSANCKECNSKWYLTNNKYKYGVEGNAFFGSIGRVFSLKSL